MEDVLRMRQDLGIKGRIWTHGFRNCHLRRSSLLCRPEWCLADIMAVISPGMLVYLDALLKLREFIAN